MQKPIKISIDTITNDTVCNYNNIRKGDTLLMSISMYQNSASLNLTGQTVHVILKKSDGYSIDKIITGITSNVVAIAFDEQATIAVGEVVGEVQAIDANGCSISNHFVYDVQATNADGVIEASKNELDTLAKIQAVIDNYNNNKTSLDAANALALTNIATIGGDITTGNALDIALKSDIAIGTPLDIALKSDISIGQALDILLKATTATGNTTINTLLTSIANGNEVIANLLNANWTNVWTTIQSILNFYEIITSGTRLTDGNGNYLTDGNGNYLTM